jgi:electron transfer flavoprotein beta subunit
VGLPEARLRHLVRVRVGCRHAGRTFRCASAGELACRAHLQVRLRYSDEEQQSMNIVVCVKQIIDPEIPAAKFRVDEATARVVPPEGLPPVINPYDAQAVELALGLKEKTGGKISVLTVGGAGSEKVVKHALSMGADEGAVLADAAFEGSDAFGVARILAGAVRKLGEVDLVLCGRQAADWDEGLVGAALAEELAWPLVTLAAGIEVEGKRVRVRRVTLEGFQVFGADLPAVVTVSNEAGRPRLPSGWGIVQATRKKVPAWGAADMGLDPGAVGTGAARRKLVRLFAPQRGRTCRIMQGETSADAARDLAGKLAITGAR